MNNLVWVGGYCGSGTRVIQMILREVGYNIGIMNNTIESQYDFLPLANIQGHLLLDTQVSDKKLRELISQYYFDEQEFVSIKHGFLMACLPVIFKAYPKAKYIQVVRHGIDNILNDHRMDEDIGMLMYPPDKLALSDELVIRRMWFWNEIHKKFEKDRLEYEDRVLVVQLEKLVDNTKVEIKRIFDFLGIGENPKYFEDIVGKPISIGRRHKKKMLEMKYPYFPDLDIDRLWDIGEEMLDYYGYAKI